MPDSVRPPTAEEVEEINAAYNLEFNDDYEYDADRIAIFPAYMSDGPSYTGWTAIALGGEICFVSRFVKRLDAFTKMSPITFDGGEEF